MTTAETLGFCRSNLLPITLLDSPVEWGAPRTYREFVPLADGTWQVRHYNRSNATIWCDRCGSVGCDDSCDYETLTDEGLIELLDRSSYRGRGIWSKCRSMEVKA